MVRVTMTVCTNSLHKTSLIGTFDGFLSGWIDIGYKKHIGTIESACELVKEQVSTRVAMRLKYDHDTTLKRSLRSF